MAESFGEDPQRYDAARPAYPEPLVARVLAGLPTPPAPSAAAEPGATPEAPGGDAPAPGRAGATAGATSPDILDVGCGTGIAARQFQAAGRAVLGVEPDARMAEFARSRGLPVEVATFEEWQPEGRTFAAVVAAQSWHWVDPAVGARKAAEVLRPGGRLAVFGHVYEPPPEVAEPFAAAFRRAVPDSPFAADRTARRPVEAYRTLYAGFAESIRATGRFEEPEQWRHDWERPYTRDEWLALLPTTGGLTRLRPAQLAGILTAVGAAIDALGGGFTMHYTTLATTAAIGT
jgi:SAM-dependent methyltransferase